MDSLFFRTTETDSPSQQGDLSPIPVDAEAEDAACAMLELAERIPPKAISMCDKMVQVTPTLLKTPKFSVVDVIKSSSQLRAFTGIVSLEKFGAILTSLQTLENLEERKYTLQCRDRLFLTLAKLKVNLSYACLSALFDITPTTCRKYFGDTLERLSRIMKKVIRFPTKAEIAKNLPKCFSKFANTRVILDGTEIKIEKSKCLRCRIRTYSHYKGAHTMKILIGVTPSGMISFVGDCMGGRASDKVLFLRSGLLEVLNREDAVMVDKGFLIENECLERGITLIRPPFKEAKKQMSPSDAYKTAAIASARVHVERSIQRLKNFKILKNELPQSLLPYCDNIMIVTAGLTNLSCPILSKNRFLA